MEKFTEHVIDIIKSIPPGRVMTYGQIAKIAGSPRAARQVVRILHSLSEQHNLPWHRVINSKGEIGFQDEDRFRLQKTRLELEGIKFSGDRNIDLHQYIWEPEFYF